MTWSLRSRATARSRDAPQGLEGPIVKGAMLERVKGIEPSS